MFSPDEVWKKLADHLEVTGKLVCTSPHDDTAIVAAEGVRHVFRLLTAAAQVSLEAADADFPRFARILSPTLQYGLPAADCSYLYAPVRGEHTYRIHGRRGTAHLFHVEVSADVVPHLDRWTRFDGREEFELGPAGEIEIVLSRQPQPGNWIRLPDGPQLGCVLVRQYFYDWDGEEAAQLDIERVGATYPPPPYDAQRATEGVSLIDDFFSTVPALCAQAVGGYYAAEPAEIPFRPLPFGWKDLSYGMGHFRCAPNEAVILEVTPPECPYWAFQLMNHQWEALDWHLRQTSLNGHQARIDPDGVFRAVISHRDPGVANWLDPAGHTVGLVAGRYFRPPVTAPASLRTVPFESLDDALPSETARLTPDERQTALRRRMLSVRRRMAD